MIEYLCLYDYARQYQLDHNLIKAIISVESAWETWSVRIEPNWTYFSDIEGNRRKNHITFDTEKSLQRHSWGLMQVMGSVARELGFDGPLPKLCEPETGILYGCKKLVELRKKYSNITDVIAAYNAGHAASDSSGRYINQEYVDKVLANMNQGGFA